MTTSSQTLATRPFVVAVATGLVAFLFRFLTQGAIENDHYVVLARAYQMLQGAWPVRDFEDPGMPLAYTLSAAAAWVGGPTLLSEAVLCILLLAVGAGLTVVAAWYLSDSVAPGIVAVVVELALQPRLYNALKVLVPVAAVTLACRYAARPSKMRAAHLGAWTGIAFLARHDYLLYLGAATVPLVLVARWPDRRAVLIELAAWLGMLAALITPWLAYVEWTLGVQEYVRTALGFTLAESQRTVGTWPSLPAHTPMVQLVVFYAALLLPVGLLGAAAGRSVERRAAAAFTGGLALLLTIVFLRDSIPARLPDITGSLVLVVVALVAPFVGTPRASKALVALAGVATVAAMAVLSGRYGLPTPAAVARQVVRVATRLGAGGTGAGGAEPARRSIDYVARCTPPGAPVLVVGFAPEIPVLAGRPFAGRVPEWLPGYFQREPEISRAVVRLQQEKPPVAIMLDGSDIFASSWPAAARWLTDSGYHRHAAPRLGANVVVWTRGDVSDRDERTGLPCLH